MKNTSIEFTHAITRKPSQSIVNGLRAEDIGTPDLAAMLDSHAHYVRVLKDTGADVIELDATDDFPDATFVEDTALCLPECAILMRPGAPTRMGEVNEMAPTLKKLFSNVEEIKTGHIEGGDILVTSKEILVGLSARTDQTGVDELTKIADKWGYKVRVVMTPPGVLHFKTDCSLLDDNTILSTKLLADSGCFEGYDLVFTEEGEEACANTIRFNKYVVMPANFPKTAAKLRGLGYDVQEVSNVECAKLDGGMSCLSLRINPS